ncbi:MAG: dihydrodipicolinate synthase family protein [Tepidisphaerales bacterium]
MMDAEIRAVFSRGVVIPASPLALDGHRRLDERRQRALWRYYLAAGAGGIALGVHTTQFAIRDAKVGLYEPLLSLAREEFDRAAKAGRPPVRIGGIIGPTAQAVREATLLRDRGFHAGLLGLGALRDASDDELIAHCRAVADIVPVMGFYLQPAAGGRLLPHSFWRRFAEIENVVAIKIAPFNRYQTLDVVRAVAESGREDIALYTGNDDNIMADLVTPFRVDRGGRAIEPGQPHLVPPAPSPAESGSVQTTPDTASEGTGGTCCEHPIAGVIERRIVGGLLGHWAVWTRRAVEQLAMCHGAGPEQRHEGTEARRHEVAGDVSNIGNANATSGLSEILRLGVQVTDANAVIFDAANGFAGCIAGIHEVLRRQRLLEGIWLLDEREDLSPGQAEEIDRVYRAYPHLNDDAFVAEHRDEWLRG